MASTASRAMRVCCWDTRLSAALTAQHPLQSCSEWPTDWSRFSIRSGERPPDRCRRRPSKPRWRHRDRVRSLLGRLTHNWPGGPVSRNCSSGRGSVHGARDAAARVSGSRVPQYDLAMRRDDRGLFPSAWEVEVSSAEPAVLQTYLRGLKTWSAAAQYQNCPELEEPLAQQLRILDAALRTGATLGG